METISIFKIGNYANFLDDKVIQFDENYDMREISIFESFKYKGIELTTDWLLAFGFKEGIDRETEDRIHDFYDGVKNNNEAPMTEITNFYEKFRYAAFYQKDNFLIAYSEYEKSWIYLDYNKKIGKIIFGDSIYKYVHELQNLYHSKTKNQLVVKS